MDFFDTLKTSLKACSLHDRIYINSLVFLRWVFIKQEQNYVASSTSLDNDNTYFDVSIQNIWFKVKNTENTERRKGSFTKKTVENAYIFPC